LRLILLASLLLVIALGLVGVALNTAYSRSAISSLQARMESYVYLVLAAIDVDEIGKLSVEGEIGDPRLSQPGSGVYAHVHGSGDHWSAPSSLGLRLPELPQVATGESRFSAPQSEGGLFSYQYGVSWQLEDGTELPLTVTVQVESDEVEQQTIAFRQGLWTSLGAAGVILALSQVLMFMFGFRPLRRVAQDVANIESGRESRLENRYPRELEPLARNVNRLLDTEEANQQRYRNALDSLAHSLKTPLAVIRAGLELPGGSATEAMQKAAGEMNHLITTRLERAGASTRRALGEPVRVRPQTERVTASLDKVYSHKMIAAEVTIPDELQFYGEQRDLLELMGNLLDNAYKYGEGRVRVTAGVIDAGASRPGLWIRIEDDGAGIDERHWLRLLQRGARGDERVEGHGLGLAIVMELVSAYGGDVSIGRSDLGGAMLYLEIPAT
jgi:two-component system sensor histidine kinase PhoQ